MKLRIINKPNGTWQYYLQAKYWFWPFWVTLYNTDYEDFARNKAERVLKYGTTENIIWTSEEGDSNESFNRS